MQRIGTLEHLLVVSCQGAALAAIEIFGRLKTEAGGISQRRDPAAFPDRARPSYTHLQSSTANYAYLHQKLSLLSEGRFSLSACHLFAHIFLPGSGISVA